MLSETKILGKAFFIAAVLLLALSGAAAQSIYFQTGSVEMKTCTDLGCQWEASQFLPNEEIYLVVGNLEGISIEGKVRTPEGDSFQLYFVENKARIVSDRIGEHEITVTASGQEPLMEGTLYFTITESPGTTPPQPPPTAPPSQTQQGMPLDTGLTTAIAIALALLLIVAFIASRTNADKASKPKKRA